MPLKEFRSTFKAMDEAGSGSAVFATLNEIDKDDDVTLPGAFGDQIAKFVAAHDWKAPNIGRATIHESATEAIADFALYMNMASAKEWHEALKGNFAANVPQEFSYGFDIIDSERGQFKGRTVRFLKKLRVIEVSPVMVGAGVNTRLTGIKDAKALSGSWEQTQEAIRAAAFELLVSVDAEGERDGWVTVLGTYRDRVVVQTYKYTGTMEDHFFEFDWEMGPDGKVTLSNQREVALEVVVREKSLKYDEEFARVLGDSLAFLHRSKALAATRKKEGRTLSAVNRDRLERFEQTLGALQTDVAQLLAETAPAPAPDANAADEAAKGLALYADFLRLTAKRAGHFGGQACR